jgi:type IV secretory pathway VirD2 relaxase
MQFRQRCAVRITYSANKLSGQWRAHGCYIARESAGHAAFGVAQSGGTASRDTLDPAAALATWQSEGDPRLWKMIVSPEFGERVDLDKLTRHLMSQMERDLGSKLEWVAVVHHNTEHPHVHIALRGIREDKSPLELPRDYVRRGVRAVAEDVCTRQLGYRTQADAIAAERREIDERRYTSLDRTLNRRGGYEPSTGIDSATHFPVITQHGSHAAREQHLQARLIVLETMGLAQRHREGQWLVRRDFETVLRVMQRATDRQKVLAANGALLSDERLPLAVLDLRKLRSVEGRIVAHGEEEAGRHYLLLEGTDAQVHLIYYTPEMERARAAGKLRVNAFVRLQKLFENGRPILEIHDEGDAEKLLRNERHFKERVRSVRDDGAEIGAEESFGGWLGRYRSMMAAAIRDAKAHHMQPQTRSGPQR